MAMGQAYRVWSDLDEVIRIYIACAVMNTLGWARYVVDHIVPIQGVGNLVLGLHTHDNLQVITYAENRSKGNWVWPQMEPLCPESLPLMRA